jgi:hypothetical protein
VIQRAQPIDQAVLAAGAQNGVDLAELTPLVRRGGDLRDVRLGGGEPALQLGQAGGVLGGGRLGDLQLLVDLVVVLDDPGEGGRLPGDPLLDLGGGGLRADRGGGGEQADGDAGHQQRAQAAPRGGAERSGKRDGASMSRRQDRNPSAAGIAPAWAVTLRIERPAARRHRAGATLGERLTTGPAQTNVAGWAASR